MCVFKHAINRPVMSGIFGMPGRPGALVCCLAMTLMLSCANVIGSYITMATSFSVTETSEGPMLEVMAENRGDVAAHDVRFEVVIADTTLVGPVAELLQESETTSAEFSMADVFGIQGRYPVVIKTNYKDKNGYRFTALSAGYYDYRIAVTPDVSITGNAIDIPVDGQGRLKFVIRNDGKTGQKLNLSLFLPNELSVAHEQASVHIEPRQEMTVQYDVWNFSALINSNYQIYLVGWYEDAGRRFGMNGSAVVRITGGGKSAEHPVWIWALMGGLLPGVIIFLRLRQRQTLSSDRVKI
jgi:hypothetical protein